VRPVSIQTFIQVVYCDDGEPPSPATIRRRFGFNHSNTNLNTHVF